MRERRWQRKTRERRERDERHEQSRGELGDGVLLYGWHTVTAALANPARRFRKLMATENALRRLAEDGITPRDRARSGAARTPSRRC